MTTRIDWHRNIYGDYFTKSTGRLHEERLDDEDVLNLLNRTNAIEEENKALREMLKVAPRTEYVKANKCDDCDEEVYRKELLSEPAFKGEQGYVCQDCNEQRLRDELGDAQ